MKLSYILIAILIVVGVFYQLKPKQDTIFLCTTYLDCPKRDSWAMFQQGINNLLRHHSPQTLHRIHRWVVINEYSAKPKQHWSTVVQTQYPFIEFIQKTKAQQGQAKSLNILLTYIPNYKYWIHWEESWYPTRPFLHDAWNAMDTSTSTQLQFTKNEHGNTDFAIYAKTCNLSNICQIHHTYELGQALTQHLTTSQEVEQQWPLYSLRPSINRVSFYNFGNFSLQPFDSPYTSEYDFARRWYQHGGQKAIFADGPVTRPSTYISTHD